MIDSLYSYQSLASSPAQERARLLAVLSAMLASLVRGGDAFHDSVYAIVDQLRALGHNVWSFDEYDETQIWHELNSPQRPGLVVTFTPSGVDVVWSCEESSDSGSRLQ